jgi:hypothetical protein
VLPHDSVKPVGPQRQGWQGRGAAPFSSRSPALLFYSTAGDKAGMMRNATQVQRLLNGDRDLRVEFVDQRKEPFTSIEIRAEETDDRVVCRAEWGGWSWRAEAHDRPTAQRRLNDRLARLDPFDHADADWGHPGHQVGALDERIPQHIRRRMRDYTQREARSAVGLLEAVFEAQARRPWAFPRAGTEVAVGGEIEGYITDDGALALFPRTFYEIANSYFGRTVTRGALTGTGSAAGTDGGEHPRLTGALRRLNEKGYMSSADGKLPHQLQSIEVYVFRAAP